jgi:hypothetical protein
MGPTEFAKVVLLLLAVDGQVDHLLLVYVYGVDGLLVMFKIVFYDMKLLVTNFLDVLLLVYRLIKRRLQYYRLTFKIPTTMYLSMQCLLCFPT